jgi:2EXR family
MGKSDCTHGSDRHRRPASTHRPPPYSSGQDLGVDTSAGMNDVMMSGTEEYQGSTARGDASPPTVTPPSRPANFLRDLGSHPSRNTSTTVSSITSNTPAQFGAALQATRNFGGYRSRNVNFGSDEEDEEEVVVRQPERGLPSTSRSVRPLTLPPTRTGKIVLHNTGDSDDEETLLLGGSRNNPASAARPTPPVVQAQTLSSSSSTSGIHNLNQSSTATQGRANAASNSSSITPSSFVAPNTARVGGGPDYATSIAGFTAMAAVSGIIIPPTSATVASSQLATTNATGAGARPNVAVGFHATMGRLQSILDTNAATLVQLNRLDADIDRSRASMTSNNLPGRTADSFGRPSILSRLPATLQATQRHHQQTMALTQPLQAVRSSMARSGLARAQSQARHRTLGPVAATTFHPFTKLPNELKIKVWKLLLPGPRIIEIKAVTITEGDGGWSEITYDRCVAISKNPVLLYMCPDSRAFAKQYYELSFQDELKFPVYMDHSRDVLLFHEMATIDVFALSCGRTDGSTPPSLSKIKYVLLDPNAVHIPFRSRPLYHFSIGTRSSPSYRFEEIAATYGSLKEIVVLKHPTGETLNPHFTSFRGYNVNHAADIETVHRHLKFLLRLSISVRYPHGGLYPTGAASQAYLATQLLPGGPWGHGNTPVASTPLANGAPAIPWKIPKVTGMTIQEVKQRMQLGEDENDDVAK